MQTLFGVVYFETELEGSSVLREVAKWLISGGLECKLLSIFEDLLSSKYPEQMVCLIVILYISLICCAHYITWICI